MAEHTVRACLITNPRSGRGGIDLSAVLPILQAQGWQVDVRQKLHGGYATKLAREAAEQGYNVVVAGGGDGTVREIVDGLVGTDVALGVLPGGTVNLWTRELGISADLRMAAMQLVGSVRRRVDVGHVAINGRHGQHFLLMAGLGLDGAVIARVSKPLKNRIGPLAVGLAALEAVPGFRPVYVRANLDGLHWQGRVLQIIVGNTRRYGGFTRLTPGAYIDDGLLDICLIGALGPIRAGRQLASLVLRGHPSPTSAESYRVSTLTIEASSALPLQVDGGAVRLTKKDKPTAAGMVYTFSLLAQGLSVLIPRTYDGELFARDALLEPITRSVPIPLSLPGSANGTSNGHKPGKRELRVTGVGVDSFTAVRLRNGKVVRVLLGASTTLKNGTGKKRPAQDALGTLAAGQVVQVKGKRNRKRGTIGARGIKLLDLH